MGTRTFQSLERQGRGVGHPTPSSADFKEKVKLYLCSALAFMFCSRVKFTLPLPLKGNVI
jgi:hypothetical protein